MIPPLKFGNVEVAVREGLAPRDVMFVPDLDEHHEFDEGVLETLATGVSLDVPVLMVGPTGSGKTTTVRNLAAALGQPVRRINLPGKVRAADLLGEKVLEVDEATGEVETTWRDGVLPDAWRHGYWLLLDEFDAMPAHVAFVIQSALEGGDIVLANNHGEAVPRHPLTRIIATANTIGRGDETGLYSGTNVLNEATLDRFCVAEVGYLSPKSEATVLVRRTGIKRTTAHKMVDCARQVREALDRGDCYATLSTRRLVAWGRFAVAMGSVEKAYRLTVRGKLGDEDARFFDGIVQRALDIGGGSQ